MEKLPLKIIIIDDNPNIHQDVIKVLTVNKRSQAFEELDEMLFNDPTDLDDTEIFLPEFQFETASQGKEGLKKIEKAMQDGKPYALAFVDIRMPPGWDGIETIQRIWKIDPDIQIVICTAYSDYSWEETVQQLGMSDNFLILKKPFDHIAVRQLACALTRKWLLAQDSRHHMEFLEQTVKEKTQTLQQSVSLLRATLESTTDGVLVLDLKAKIIDYNKRFLKLWDLARTFMDKHNGSEIQEYILNKLLKPEEFQEVLKLITNEIDRITKHFFHLKNGKIFECYSQPHLLNKKIVGRVWSFRDVTERAFLEKELEHQATHDSLTDLPNRVLLYDRIKQAINLRNNKNFAIFFFDLDRFKLVNDSLGHAFGDKLLGAVARRLGTLIRKGDTLARLGGDEFVMVLPGLSDIKDISDLAQKILGSFEVPFDIAGHKIAITTSIGISLFPDNGKTPSRLLKNADLAMYQAKEPQGNKFSFYFEKLNRQNNLRYKKELALRNAIINQEFFLLYQPQFDIEKRTLLSVEALIRWKHPQKGIILPIEFIPVAEESGLIIPMGEWVIREVCRQISSWRAQGLPFMRVAANVAMQQLQQANFAETVASILNEYNIPPEYLEIEITENVIIRNAEIMRMINQLKSIGVRIVLDDFGTGNSSLNYLKKVQIDRLKIDRSFISNINRSRSDEVIIEAIIAMGQSLSFKVLAEGVENQNQINFLKNRHCDEIQGFYYSKPLSSEDLSKYIKSYRESSQI